MAETENTKQQPSSQVLRPIGQLLTDAWGIFAKGWLKYLLLAIITGAISIAVFVAYIFVAIMTGLWAGFKFDFFGETGHFFTGSWPLLLAIVLAGVLLLAIVGSIFSLATNKIVYNVAEGNNEGIKQTLKYSWKNFIPYFIVMLIFGLMIVGGYILLVIPGIIFTVFLSLVVPVFVLEGLRGTAVLKRSWQLVKGNFWPVFGRLLIVFAFGIIISLISNGRYENSIAALMSLVTMILQFILTFFGIGYTYLIYKDLSAKKA